MTAKSFNTFTKTSLPEGFSIETTDSCRQALSRIIRSQAMIMLANTEGTVQDFHPEFLHQLRVATRRARFSLKLFSDFLTVRKRSIMQPLSWIASLLGAVRDIDVTLEMMSEKSLFPPELPLDIVKQRIESIREEERKKLVRALSLKRYMDQIKRMNDLNWNSPVFKKWSRFNVPVEAMTSEFITRKIEKIKSWENSESFSVKDLHKIRIDFKGLRYTSEFFEGFYGKSFSKRIKDFTKMQDSLGIIHDCSVAVALLQRIAAEYSGPDRNEVCVGIGRMIQILDTLQKSQTEKFLDRWKIFPKTMKAFEKTVKNFEL